MVILPRWLPTLLMNVLLSETTLRVWDASLVDGRVVLIGDGPHSEPLLLSLSSLCPSTSPAAVLHRFSEAV